MLISYKDIIKISKDLKNLRTVKMATPNNPNDLKLPHQRLTEPNNPNDLKLPPSCGKSETGMTNPGEPNHGIQRISSKQVHLNLQLAAEDFKNKYTEFTENLKAELLKTIGIK